MPTLDSILDETDGDDDDVGDDALDEVDTPSSSKRKPVVARKAATVSNTVVQQIEAKISQLEKEVEENR